MNRVADFKIFEDAHFIPVRRGLGRIGSVLSYYGARDGTGHRLPKWPLLNSLDTSFAINVRRPQPSNSEEFLPEAIFGGMYYNWFGHFLTETVPNLLAAKAVLDRAPNIPVVFFVPDNKRPDEVYPRLSPWATFFMSSIGISPARFHFVRAPLNVQRLLVGPSPFTRKHHFAPWALLALDELFGPTSTVTRRDLYLSRTQWAKVRTSDETVLERHFSARGYDVTHLEALSLEDQIATIRGARHVAGCTGTALHWTLYSASCKSVMALGYRSPLQRGISKSRGQLYINPRGRRVANASIRVRDFDEQTLDRALDQVCGR